MTSGVGTGIAGTYGTLTLAADGSYTYTANPDTTGLSGNHADTFTYTVKDADGSTSTTTLTVNVNEVHPTASVATGTVYEAGLPNGSASGRRRRSCRARCRSPRMATPSKSLVSCGTASRFRFRRTAPIS